MIKSAEFQHKVMRLSYQPELCLVCRETNNFLAEDLQASGSSGPHNAIAVIFLPNPSPLLYFEKNKSTKQTQH